MTTLASVEAKAHFSELLERASKGEDFVITRRGVPLVRVVPFAHQSEEEANDLLDDLREFRSGVKPVLNKGESLNELARSGAKW